MEMTINRLKLLHTPTQEKMDIINFHKNISVGNDVIGNNMFKIDSLLLDNFKISIIEKLKEFKLSPLYNIYPQLGFLKDYTRDIFSPLLLSNNNNTKSFRSFVDKSEHKNVSDVIDIEDLGLVAKNNMPLCMRLAYEKLREDHHLKNWGRMIFYSFLKEINVPMKNIRSILEKEHCKIMTPSTFNSKYKYDIEYICGQKNRPVQQYKCVRIINQSLQMGDGCIGCPFKLFDDITLSSKMEKLNLDSFLINEILNLRRQNNYIAPQLQCLEYFKYVHQIEDIDFVLHSPKTYYSKSCEAIGK